MILSKDTDIIEIILTAPVTTNQLQVVAEWENFPTASEFQNKISTLTNNATAVALVIFEDGTIQRTLNNLFVYNNDTVNSEVTIRLNDNGTYFIYKKCVLLPQETLEYNLTNGFFVSNTGNSLIVSALKTKAIKVLIGSFAGNPKKATVTFATPFADAEYSISAIGVDSRSWTFETKLAGSFVINASANLALTGDVLITATKIGEN